MERFFLLLSTVCLALASLDGNSIDTSYQVSKSISTIYPPQIEDSSSGELIINAHETLNLTCRGRHRLRWEINNHTNFDSRITQMEKVDIQNNSTMFTSILQIINTTYEDTGFIRCFYEGTTNMDNLENVTSIYVYVFDPSNLFVPSQETQPAHNLIIQPIYQHRESIIPCRPCHPDVMVTLIKSPDHITVTSKRKNADSTQSSDVEYDPREGYNLNYPNMFFSGEFICTGELGNITQNISLHLMWFSDTTGPPQPHIDGNGHYIVLNDTFVLTCIVNIEVGTLLQMEWKYPNTESLRFQQSEMTASDKTSNNGYTFREVMRNLTVKNVKLSDSGNYSCLVTDHTGKSNYRQKVIKIFNTSCHLDLETEVIGTTAIIASKEKQVRFNVHLEAHPAPKVIWTKNQTEIRSGNGEKYIINVTRVNTTLVIKKPNRHDSNNYTVTASVCDKMREIVFPLTVWEEPVVTLESYRNFYLRGSKDIIMCTAEGNPPPRIEWEWQPCSDLNCRIQENKFRLAQKIKTLSINIRDSEPTTDPGIRKSSLEFIPQQSGHFRCKAKNDHGNTNATVFIISSDYKDGFAIRAPSYELAETMSMTLECGITRFNYSSLFWQWRPANNNQSEFVRVEHKKNGFKLESKTSSEVFVQSIILDEAYKSISGEYMCVAKETISEKEVNRTITIDIKEIRPPEFSADTNLNGSVISVKVDGTYQLKCKVNGTPQPQITWLKDGKHIDEKKKPWLKFNLAKTLLNITRLRIEDSGLYVCEAENLGGNTSVNISIKVIGDDVLINSWRSSDDENDPSWTIYLIVAIVIISLILLVLVGFVVKKFKEEAMNRRELELIGQMLFEHGDPNSYNPDLPLDDQVELLPYDKRWEFPKERLKLGKTLGQGAFGRVVKAEAIGLQDGEASTTVAVKMLKQRADLNQKKALMQELKVMIHLGRHVNVVNLLAAVTKNIKKGELYVIVEFCRYGNMRHFLLRHRDNFINQIDPKTGKINQRINEFHNLDQNSASELKAIEAAANTNYGQNRPLHYADLTFSSYKNSIGSGHDSDFTTIPTDMSLVTMSTTAPKSSYNSSSGSGGSDYLTSYKGETKDRPLTTCDLLCYSFQVARGMEYLSSRKLVHRDLAARNILLADDNVVKICDFGLAKDLYKYSNYKKKGDGPLPIKWMALESVRDKVFSSQSDVWSFGIVLWEFFTLGGSPYPGIEIDEEFYKKLKSGYRMDQPECATAEVYDIMQSCWLAEARDRPNFTELVEQLGEQLESSIRKYYVDLNNPYMTMNDTFRNNNDYLTMDTGDDRNYVNIDHVITPPLSPEYVNVSSRPRHDSINSDYLSMQSPIRINFNHTNSPFHNYTNVDKFRANNGNALELKPLTVPEDPWIPRDLGLNQSLPTNIPMTPTSDQSDYLFMGNRDSDFDKKGGSGSASSDSSSGFHSDFTDNSAPPSYNVVVNRDEYVV